MIRLAWFHKYHLPDMSNDKRKAAAAWLSVASNSSLIAMKIVVGLLVGSVAVISEAIHSGVDLLASFIAVFAIRQSVKPPDEQHPFGHGKFENVSGTVEALLIFVAAGWIIYEAIGKIQAIFANISAGRPDAEMPVHWGVLVMFVSAAVNYAVSHWLFKVGKETDSVALQADGWHLRTDVYTSVGVMIGLGLIVLGDHLASSLGPWLHLLDPAAAIAVALLIFHAAWVLTARSARDLMDATLPEDEQQQVRDVLKTFAPEMHGFHRMRTRKAGPVRFVEVHIFVDPQMTVQESHLLSHQIAQKIQEHLGDWHVSVHVEPCRGGCELGRHNSQETASQ